MLTAVRPATDDSFVSEASVPLSFSPAPADPRTRGSACTLSRGPYCRNKFNFIKQCFTNKFPQITLNLDYTILEQVCTIKTVH